MALKIAPKNAAVWVLFPGDESAKFLLKPLTLSVLQEARASVRKKVAIPVKEDEKGKETKTSYQFTDDVDDFDLSRAIFYASLEDWEGVDFEWEDGKSHPKTDEKDALFNYKEVREFVVTKASELGDEFGKDKKAAEKN